MGIDWTVVESTLRKSIERNQHATGEAVPKLAQAILGLAEVERRCAAEAFAAVRPEPSPFMQKLEVAGETDPEHSDAQD